MITTETRVLKEMDHPNIARMFETFEDKKRVYIVSEICKGGELFDEIIRRGSFCERDAAMVIKQVLNCINYCHSNNVVHRDIKPENILLESNKAFDQIKMIDFGSSLFNDPNSKLKEKLGTPYYIAPEVLNANYGSKCDIWSIGVLTYILLCGYPPFNGDGDEGVMKAVKRGKYAFGKEEWGEVSSTAKDFIKSLLTYN
jgi:calcium-dependent protein kinase